MSQTDSKLVNGLSDTLHYVKQQFSEQLIDRMVAYALKKYNLRISRDEAVEHLRSLGNLYITVSKIRARKHKKKTDQLSDNQTHAS